MPKKEHLLPMRKLKLIWDFRGPTANHIAEHHAKHLSEYASMEQLELGITGFDNISDMYAIAYIVVYENNMIQVRDALKPHRGEVYQE